MCRTHVPVVPLAPEALYSALVRSFSIRSAAELEPCEGSKQ